MSKARARERAKRKAANKTKRNSGERIEQKPWLGTFNQGTQSSRGPRTNADIKNVALKTKGAARSR